eukprot:gene19532-21463_t
MAKLFHRASSLRYLGGSQTTRSFATTNNLGLNYKFVVVGGGAGGLSVASFLARKFPNEVAIVEKSDKHYYQPMWTLVGAGVKDVSQSIRPMESVMPKNASWIRDAAVEFNPESNSLVTDGGKELKYEYLVMATGLQLNFHKVKGLKEALGMPGVGCNYSVDTVQDTFKAIKNFKGGNAIFTLPNSPIKCQGAPQKIMYLANDYFCQNGLASNKNVRYFTALPFMFAVEKYRKRLEEVCKNRDIDINYRHNLIEINYADKIATFELLDETGKQISQKIVPFDMIHVTPPQGPITAVAQSPLADAAGFVDINKQTMRHVKYPNVFALGDCSNAPISKTAAAVAGQNKVVRKNLMAIVNGKEPLAQYDGYTSCPLLTGYNKCILAEFDYTGQPLETLPIDQGKERRISWHLKVDMMPDIYWHFLLKGYWGGPGFLRKIFHLGFSK